MPTTLGGVELPVYVDTPEQHPYGVAVLDITRVGPEGSPWTVDTVTTVTPAEDLPECTCDQAAPCDVYADGYDQQLPAGTVDICPTCQPQLFE